MKKNPKEEPSRRCPYCDEPIRENAKKCRFCGEWLTKTEKKINTKKDYTHNFLLGWIVSLLMFFAILAAANYDFLTAPDYLGILLGIDILFGMGTFLLLIPRLFHLLFSKKSRMRGLVYLAATILFFFSFFVALGRTPSNYTPPTATSEPKQQIIKPTPTSTTENLKKDSTSSTGKTNSDTSKSNTTTNPNTPVHCNIHQKCGGGTTPLTKAECDNSVCCEVGPDKWVFMKDKSQCQNDGPVAAPNSSKKVQFTTTEALVNGTYYCYEDRVNDLTKMENLLKIMSTTANTCSISKQFVVDNCVRDNCSIDNPNWTSEWSADCFDKCYESKNECITDFEELGEKRKEYMNLIYKICP